MLTTKTAARNDGIGDRLEITRKPSLHLASYVVVNLKNVFQMKIHKIYDEDGKGFTRIITSPDVEYVNPVMYYSDYIIFNSISLEKDLLAITDPILASKISDDYFFQRAKEKLFEKYEEIENTKIPPNLIEILEGKSKKTQIQLLKGQTLTPDQLMAYLFSTYLDFGFTFSQYISENLHKGLDRSALPRLIHVDGKEVKSIGSTTLSKGQMRQVVEQRKVITAKFLDKGDTWHCFFGTLDSFGGKESWKDGQAHFHYISDKWGIPRDVVIAKIKSGVYPSTSVHIGLLNYRDQSKDEE